MKRRLRSGIILASTALVAALGALVAQRPDLAVPMPPSAAPADAAPRVLWHAGMEQGNLDQWSGDRGGGKFNTGAADTVASRDHAHSGAWSMKLTIPGNEMAASRLFRWKEARQHRELYYSAWYFVPQHYRLGPEGWTNWFQFKSRMALMPWRHDPFFILGWRNVGPREAMHFVLLWWHGLGIEGPRPGQHGEEPWVSPIEMPVGRWFHLEARYVCAGDFSGAIQVWQDGVEIFNVEGVKTRHAMADCRWAVNNYGAHVSPRPVVIYVDDAVIATARRGPRGDDLEGLLHGVDYLTGRRAYARSPRRRRRSSRAKAKCSARSWWRPRCSPRRERRCGCPRASAARPRPARPGWRR
jgi:hypothetical protein